MNEFIEVLSDEVVFSGRLIDVSKRTLKVQKDGNTTEYSIEVARRPPGIRLLVERDEKYLLLKEFRSELSGWDYRLAGGKVFETQRDHLNFLASGGDIYEKLLDAVRNEGREELGISINSANLELTSRAGATIEWDLYFFRVDKFQENPAGPNPEKTELLRAEWHSFDSLLSLIKDGRFSEDRSIGFLLKEFLSSGKISHKNNCK